MRALDEVWSDMTVRNRLAASVATGIFVTVFAALYILFSKLAYGTALVPSVKYWPSYGLYYSVPHLAQFLVGIVAEGTQSLAVVRLCTALMAVFLLNALYVLAVLLGWLTYYILGTLGPQASAEGSIGSVMLGALAALVVAVMTFVQFSQLLTTSMRAGILYRFYGVPHVPNPDIEGEDEDEDEDDDDDDDDDNDNNEREMEEYADVEGDQ